LGGVEGETGPLRRGGCNDMNRTGALSWGLHLLRLQQVAVEVERLQHEGELRQGVKVVGVEGHQPGARGPGAEPRGPWDDGENLRGPRGGGWRKPAPDTEGEGLQLRRLDLIAGGERGGSRPWDPCGPLREGAQYQPRVRSLEGHCTGASQGRPRGG